MRSVSIWTAPRMRNSFKAGWILPERSACPTSFQGKHLAAILSSKLSGQACRVLVKSRKACSSLWRVPGKTDASISRAIGFLPVVVDQRSHFLVSDLLFYRCSRRKSGKSIHKRWIGTWREHISNAKWWILAWLLFQLLMVKSSEVVLIVFTVLPVLLFNKNRVVEFDSNKHHLLWHLLFLFSRTGYLDPLISRASFLISFQVDILSRLNRIAS